MHFSLPGLMSLLSLVDPASTTLWRVSFAVVAAGGVLALVLVRGPAPTGLGAAAYGAAVVLYLLIALVAVVPGMVAEIGVLARPLRVEAVLLTMLVFLGGTSPGCCCLTRRRPHPTLRIPHNPVGDDPRHRGCPAVQPARHPADHPALEPAPGRRGGVRRPPEALAYSKPPPASSSTTAP